MRQIIVAGAGGHAGVVIDMILALGEYEIVGLVERESASTKSAHGFPVIATDETLTVLRERNIFAAANGVGSSKDNGPRRLMFECLKSVGFLMPSLLHPRAWLAPSAELGEGVQVMSGCFIQRNVRLSDNVLVNTGAIIEHDSRVGAHAHISTGVRIGGQVVVGEGAFIGIGSSVKQSVRIGENAIVGAGSVVIDDIPDLAMVAGVPAQRIDS